jgi:hypothetical protein
MAIKIEIAESEMREISSPAQNYMSLAAKTAKFLTLIDGKTFLATITGATSFPPFAPDVGLSREDTCTYSQLGDVLKILHGQINRPVVRLKIVGFYCPAIEGLLCRTRIEMEPGLGARKTIQRHSTCD